MKFTFLKKLKQKIKPFRKNIVFTSLGILFVVYFLCVSMFWGRVDSFNKVMIALGFLWIIISIKIDKIIEIFKKLPKIIKIASKIILACFILSFIIVQSIIIFNMRTTSTADADYVIVLGCQVNGLIPSIPLIHRINVAAKYLRENQNTNVVVTGGQGPGEDISEAEVMQRVLIQRGIDANRIFTEGKSRSTMENFIFSDELFNLRDKNVVIVSSDYHMFRAISTAKKLNYKNIQTLPGKSRLSMLPVYLLREYAAVMYYILSGRI